MLMESFVPWHVVAERCSASDKSSNGLVIRLWVQIPAMTLMTFSKTLNNKLLLLTQMYKWEPARAETVLRWIKPLTLI